MEPSLPSYRSSPRLSPFALDDEEDTAGVPSAVAASSGSATGSVIANATAPIATETTNGAASSKAAVSAPVPAAPNGSVEAVVADVRIVDAHKAGDAKGSGYTVYVARAKLANGACLEAARRYSEYEAFRQALVRLYPVHLVPPIPDKHSLAEYAVKQTRALDDAATIARRRRMLQSFLRRLASHPVLGHSHVYLQFLDGHLSWPQIVASPPLSTLPRSNFRAPTHDIARVGAAALPAGAAEADLDDPDAFRQAAAVAAEAAAYDALPIPPATAALREPDTHFLDAEAFTDSFTNHLTGSMEKVNRRLQKRWHEAAADYAELGAVLNAFSLTEQGPLAEAIERCGQASDASFVATGTMLTSWQEDFSEPLHEYAQYGSILQKLLQWRHIKHAQVEAVSTGLDARRAHLEELEAVDAHAGRLTGALQRGGRSGLQAALSGSGSNTDAADDGLRNAVNGLAPAAPASWGDTAAEFGSEAGAGTGGGAGTGAASARQASTSIYGSAAEDAGSEDWVGATPDPGLEAASSVTAGMSASSGAAEPVPGSISRAASAARAAAGGGGGGRFGTSGLLGALGHTLSSMLDVDPEGTRRSTAARLRGQLAALEGGRGLAERDLGYANATIQADLDRFQRTKVADFRQMLVRLAKAHRAAAAESLEAWQAAQRAVDAIPAPEGMPESSLARHQRREGAALPGSSTDPGLAATNVPRASSATGL